MIRSFRDGWLERFFIEDARSARISPDLEARLFRKLQMLDDAASEQDLRVPPATISRSYVAVSMVGTRYGSISVGVWFSNGSTARLSSSISMITATGEANMLQTTRKPVTVGEILTEEFLGPLALTQSALAEAMGVPRKHVNELCNDRRSVTAPTALILARVFGTTPDFWLNVQRRTDLWTAMNDPRERERIERAHPLNAAA